VRIESAQVAGYKSIDNSGVIQLGQINVLIGENDSGKSAFLEGIYAIQEGGDLITRKIRVGRPKAEVRLRLVDAVLDSEGIPVDGDGVVTVSVDYSPGSTEIQFHVTQDRDPNAPVAPSPGKAIPSKEPSAFIYPLLSKRMIGAMELQPNNDSPERVFATLQNLIWKVQRASDAGHPHSEYYRDAMSSILGFVPTATLADGRTEIGRWANAQNSIPLEQMGRGVLSLVGILTSLANAEGRCFLIEEPENDLHPRALKQVLDLIIASSATNQFIVTTHSPTVLSYLGGLSEAKVISVTKSNDRTPTSTFQMVPDDPSERLSVMRDLGFELSDVDLVDAWLLLEEATSETFIKRYFVKWFVPELTGRLTTVSCQGVDDVEPRFIAFQRLMVFLHLSGPYRDRIWVGVDDDGAGRRVVSALRLKYANSISESHFVTFDQGNFEEYYPTEFQAKVSEVLAIEDGKTRKLEKGKLREVVEEWINVDENRAISFFEESAASIVTFLRSISVDLGLREPAP